MRSKQIPPISNVSCSVLVKFVAEDDHVYQFDNSWNVTIGNFLLSNKGNARLQIRFSFQAQLRSIDKNGHSVTLLPHEDLVEIQPYLEKTEILLDLLSLQVGTPLAIEDGSFEFNGAGFISSSNPVTNTNKLYDFPGLEKRYQNLLKNKNLINATRFFRLSQIDKEYNGKAIKLWAALEALYKGYEKGLKPIWNNLVKTDQRKLELAIKSLPIGGKEKERLLNAVKYQTPLSKQELLSQKIKLMNNSGEYTSEDMTQLLKWWSGLRSYPAHGERIKKDDEYKQSTIEDLEDTLETLLKSSLEPSLYGYFIGHPQDMDGDFWNKDDYTIKKVSSRCWIKPNHFILGATDQILRDIGHHKIRDNEPFLFVSHNKVISLSKEGVAEITNLSELSKEFRGTVQRVKRKLNKTAKLD